MPAGILNTSTIIVNSKNICRDKISLESLEINDLLENIRIVFNYIIRQKRRKNKMKNLKKNNWQIKKLSEVCDFQRGLTYSKKDEVDFSENVVLRSNNINLISGTLNLEELRYIDDRISVPENKKVKKGSIIICTANGSKNHLGKIALIDKDYGYAFGGFMGQLTPKKEIDSKYFFYILITDLYKKHLSKISSGANINNLKFSDLSELKILLPSISEQKRIVKILDEVFEKIEKAKENAEKNLKNSKELFESCLYRVFSDEELRIKNEKWEEKRLGDVCNFVRGPFGGSLKKSYFKKEGYVVYEQQHAIYNQFTRVRYFIDETKFNEMKRFELKPGDLIMSCSGTMGKIAIATDDIKKGIINQALLKLSPNKNLLNVFLKYWMESGVFQDDLKKYTKGAAIKNVVSVKILKDIKMFLPKIQEQEVIIKRLDALSAETKKLEEIYKQKLADLEELKKSVLKKAFAGEL
jgi:type I restriction enzyme S subunit